MSAGEVDMSDRSPIIPSGRQGFCQFLDLNLAVLNPDLDIASNVGFGISSRTRVDLDSES